MSNLWKRILTGVFLFLFMSLAFFNENYNFLFAFLFIAFFALGGLKEFYALVTKNQKEKPFYTLGYLCSMGILLTYYAQALELRKENFGIWEEGIYSIFSSIFYPNMNLTFLFLYLLLVSSSIYQLLSRPLNSTIYNLSVTLFGPIYVVITISYSLLFFGLVEAKFYLLWFLVLPIAYDVGAYFSGRFFGKHIVGLKSSPNKTYEGYIGGVLISILTSFFLIFLWEHFTEPNSIGKKLSYPYVIIISSFLALLSIFADLMESALKRNSNQKDSSSLLPGHGGILDLCDSIYWSIPLGYFYFLYFVD